MDRRVALTPACRTLQEPNRIMEGAVPSDREGMLVRPPVVRPRARDRIETYAGRFPARFAILVFSLLLVILTGLLLLPVSATGADGATFVDALFTATSALCVTGLATVDMATHWSPFGQVVILAGFQVGGIGVLTLASILGLAVSRRLGLTQLLLAAGEANPMRSRHGAVAESQAVRLGEVGGLLGAIAVSVLVIEGGITALLVPRLLLDGDSLPVALWHGFYYAASAFTNTGFAPESEGIARFASDPYMLGVLSLAVFLGSIGFPVIFTLYRMLRHRLRRPGLHTSLTLVMTGILIVLGAALITSLEWGNEATIGEQSAGDRIMTGTFLSIMTRSGGFSTVDIAALHGSTKLIMEMLMFVGGGSASTAGGIKVTTLAVLFLAAFAEARGYRDIQAFSRRIPVDVLRVAVSVVLWGATIVAAASIALMQMTGAPLDDVLFDVISAFGTSGLSTGFTAAAGDAGQVVLALTMWAGRVGTVTLAAAVAASTRTQLFRRPEERPIVG